jgi:hypothetical protein
MTRGHSPSLGRLTYAGRAARAIAANPAEGLSRTLERLVEKGDRDRLRWPYRVDEAAEERVHDFIGVAWPCGREHDFAPIWSATMHELEGLNVPLGRGAFGGWDDGDRRLGQMVWCMTRHLQPRAVVETGVGRGLTTRVILEALERNGDGHLWSIDLPPLLHDELEAQIGVAVPPRLRHRWHLLRGSSRRLLPGLVRDRRQIGLFVHDSLHTARNLRFELEQVWPALEFGHAAVVDDVEKNSATGRFEQDHRDASAVIAWSEDRKALIGCLVKQRPK